MLADLRCLGWRGQLFVDEFQRGGQLFGVELLDRVERKAMLELGVVAEGLGRVHRRDGRIDLIAERDPLLGGPCFEDIPQFMLEFAIAASVVGVFGARPFFE